MDYEKAYKAVLQTATQWIKDGCTDKEKICLECVFPELRESEDERIRKWLVDYFGSIKEVVWIHRDITCEQILDWLEKQKEPHIPWYDYQKSKEAGYTIVPNEEYEQLIKQKEQKPQEPQVFCEAKAFDLGYKQAEKDILSFVESRISEIIGDAQPKPALRAELEELIKRIKDGNNAGRANTTM